MSRELVIVGVFAYFVVCSAAVIWWFHPGLRDRLGGRIARAFDGGRARLLAAAGTPAVPASGTGQRLARQGAACVAVARDWAAGLGAQARWIALALGMLLAVPLLALLGRQWHGYDGFDHTASHAVNPQVAALLDGEQLVPPPPLPPEMFLTREVQAAKPMIATASRQWELLDAEFRQRLLAVFKVMREQHHVEMVLIEGYRSPERQAALASLGPHVTHAGAGRSYHQHGLAADCAFLIDGRIVISEQDTRAARGYELYGEVARSMGLTWGGGWRSLKDLGHVELRRAGVLDAAAAREDKQS